MHRHHSAVIASLALAAGVGLLSVPSQAAPPSSPSAGRASSYARPDTSEPAPVEPTAPERMSPLPIDRAAAHGTTASPAATRDELHRLSVTTVVEAIPVTLAPVRTREGFSIRGARSEMTSIRIDGLPAGDRVMGGFGTIGAELHPLPPVVALEHLSLRTSPLDARLDDPYPGAIEIATRRGPRDRYTGELRFTTDLPSLTGWSGEIAMAKVGEAGDTVLPSVKGASRGARTYELSVGGPIPGYDAITFNVAGSLTTYEHLGATHRVYDMSAEFARERDSVARALWGAALEPANLGQLPHQTAAVRWLGGRIGWEMSERSRLDLDVAYGSTISDVVPRYGFIRGGEPIPVAWRALYLGERSAVTGALEREAQQPVMQFGQRRIALAWITMLGERTDLRLSASSSLTRHEIGKSLNAGDVGALGVHDIAWQDQDGDGVADYYAEGPMADNFTLNPYNPEMFVVPTRSPRTGLYEGDLESGASRNPYGLQDLTFPAHGNFGALELREASEIDLRADAGHELVLFGHPARIEAGAAYHRYSLRGEYYPLPWYQVMFDSYGFEDESELMNHAFESGDNPQRDFLAKRRTPSMTSAYAQLRYGLGALSIQGGLHVDLWNPSYPDFEGKDWNDPNTYRDPTMLPTRLLVSPRMGLSVATGEGSELFASAALIRRMPELSTLFGIYPPNHLLRALATVRLGPERIAAYELGWRSHVGPMLEVEASGYYHAVGDRVESSYVDYPSIYDSQNNGGRARVIGLDILLRSRPVDNLDLLVRYDFMHGTETVPDTIFRVIPISPILVAFTESGQMYPLATDRTHSLNGHIGLTYGAGEGPEIGGMRPLEYSAVTLSLRYESGLPYTIPAPRGQVTDFNGHRLPDRFTTDLHIERSIPIGAMIGAGDLEMALFLDVRNLLNATGPIDVHTSDALYASTGTRFAASDDPNGNVDIDGLSPRDFSQVMYYRDIDPDNPATIDNQQYDNFGARLYNPYADLDLNGVVTPEEKYEGYKRFVTTYRSLRVNYQMPRSVAVGVRITF